MEAIISRWTPMQTIMLTDDKQTKVIVKITNPIRTSLMIQKNSPHFLQEDYNN